MGRLLTGILWIGAMIAPFALIAGMNRWTESLDRTESRWRISAGEAQSSAAATPTALPETRWTSVQLPRRVDGGAYPSSVWFRLKFAATPTEDLWAVYLARPFSSYAVFLNGELVGQSGPLTTPVAMHPLPLIFRFPGRLLRLGENVLHIRSVSETASSPLLAIEVGPDDELSPAYRSETLLKGTFKQVTVLCMFVMSLVMFTLFRLRSRDAAFGWFALALFFWAMQILTRQIARSPFDVQYLWSTLDDIAIAIFVICAALFANRYIGLRQPLIERTALYWGGASALVMLGDVVLMGRQMPWFFAKVLFVPILALAVFTTWQLFRASWRERTTETRLLACAAWFVLVAGFRDFMIELGWLAPAPFYMSYTVGPVLIIFGFLLLHRFVNAVDAAERAQHELEARVIEKTAALERNLVRLKDLEREQALARERERIMRDMHDGVGGQLVQALAIASNRSELKTLEEPLRTCLEELRLIIDSIEPVDGDLASVLGTLRMRMSRRLKAAGVRVIWDVQDLPPLTDFGPRQVVNVSRIVQEAIANALRHAHPRRITVRAHSSVAASTNERMVTIEVCDDGSGFETVEGGGRGIENMKCRARQLGARLQIVSGTAGTRVALALPSNIPGSAQPLETGLLSNRLSSDDSKPESSDDAIDGENCVAQLEQGRSNV